MMSEFTQCSPYELTQNPFSLIGKEWALLTGGTIENCNPMTVSWGGLGILWNKPVATVYVRPQRYTYGFMEENDLFTLSFFENTPEYRKVLGFCGKESGRTQNKWNACNLHPCAFDGGAAPKEASLILVCRKLYAQDLTEDCFIDKSVVAPNYAGDDFHRMYIGEIIACYRR